MHSFTEALEDPMSSSPPGAPYNSLDPNIDPSLQYQTPTRSQRLSQHAHAQGSTSQQVITSTPAQESLTPTRASGHRIPDDESSSSNDEEEELLGLSEAQLQTRRLAQNNTLNAGNTQELMNFSTLITQKARDKHLYAKLLSLEQAIGAGVSWTPSQDALRNIQRYCVSVLLSPELPSYRGSITTRIVMDVLKSVPSQLPSGWSADPHKTALIMKSVNGYLTQIRSDLKKKLLVSIAPIEDGDEVIDIAQLSDSLANGAVNVTAPLWARIAFLRGVLTTDSGSGFWQSVDTALKKLREKVLEKADGDEGKAKRKMHKQFKKILELDYQLYGNPAARAIAPSQSALQDWQNAANAAAIKAIGVTFVAKRKSPSS